MLNLMDIDTNSPSNNQIIYNIVEVNDTSTQLNNISSPNYNILLNDPIPSIEECFESIKTGTISNV